MLSSPPAPGPPAGRTTADRRSPATASPPGAALGRWRVERPGQHVAQAAQRGGAVRGDLRRAEVDAGQGRRERGLADRPAVLRHQQLPVEAGLAAAGAGDRDRAVRRPAEADQREQQDEDAEPGRGGGRAGADAPRRGGAARARRRRAPRHAGRPGPQVGPDRLDGLDGHGRQRRPRLGDGARARHHVRRPAVVRRGLRTAPHPPAAARRPAARASRRRAPRRTSGARRRRAGARGRRPAARGPAASATRRRRRAPRTGPPASPRPRRASAGTRRRSAAARAGRRPRAPTGSAAPRRSCRGG